MSTEQILTGKDVGIAILDTGLYPHLDFKNRIVAFKDFIHNKKLPYDDNGHGTQVNECRHHSFAVIITGTKLPWQEYTRVR